MSTDAATREAAKGDPVTLGGGVAGQQQVLPVLSITLRCTYTTNPTLLAIITYRHARSYTVLVVAKAKPCPSRSTEEGLHENILDHQEDR